MCSGHGSAAARRAGVVLIRRRPPVRNVCRWRPRRPRRPVWFGLRTARATTQSSRNRRNRVPGPHRTSRCAASLSRTVLWRRSVWASSLRELGITVPAADRLAGELDHQFDHPYLTAVGPAGGLLRPNHPEQAEQLNHMQRRTLPQGWDADIPRFPADAKGLAGRDARQGAQRGRAAGAVAGRRLGRPGAVQQVPADLRRGRRLLGDRPGRAQPALRGRASTRPSPMAWRCQSCAPTRPAS